MSWPVGVKKLRDGAKLPFRAHEGDAGADLFAAEYSHIPAGETVAVSTGIAVDIPRGFVGLIHPRSGLAAKHGITVLNAPGTIDAGYTGEVKVLLHNSNPPNYELIPRPYEDGADVEYVTWGNGFHVEPGDRIAQLVIQRVELPHFNWVTELEDSSRGVGGFGSTGVK